MTSSVFGSRHYKLPLNNSAGDCEASPSDSASSRHRGLISDCDSSDIGKTIDIFIIVLADR